MAGLPSDLEWSVERATLLARIEVLEKIIESLGRFVDRDQLAQVVRMLDQMDFAGSVLGDLDRLEETS